MKYGSVQAGCGAVILLCLLLLLLLLGTLLSWARTGTSSTRLLFGSNAANDNDAPWITWVKGVDRPTMASSSATTTTVCVKLGAGIYDTRHVSTLDAQSYRSSSDLATIYNDGPCNCGLLCLEYHSFRLTGNRCTCNTDHESLEAEMRTLPIAQNYSATNSLQRRNLQDEDFFDDDDDDDISTCIRMTDQCGPNKRCPSNQICIPPEKQPQPLNGSTVIVARCGCEPIQCANPYGNPCGPDAACRDTATGYACTKLVNRGCLLSCGPFATCAPTVFNATTTIFSCQCLLGYRRNATYLPCTASP